MTRKYDIILLGATGYTGKLTAKYLARNLPKNTSWALAGRNEKKLVELSSLISDTTPAVSILPVDLESENSIADLCKSTRVLINAIGPYASTCGSEVFKSCAIHGTDYVDCNGEPVWRQAMIEAYDTVARESGAKMIITCGWGCVPGDLATYLAVTYLRETFNLPAQEVICSIHDFKAMFSGGSMNSLCTQRQLFSRESTRHAAQLFAISPTKPTYVQASESTWLLPQMNALGLQNVPHMGTMTISTEGEIEEPLVGRSWGLRQDDPNTGYGPRFKFSSRMGATNSLTAMSFRATWLFLGLLLNISLVRTLLTKYVFPSGEGPSETARKEYYSHTKVLAIADEGSSAGTDGRRKGAVIDFRCPRDSYEFTGAALSEAAMLLLEGGTEAHERSGGVLTPSMLGKAFLARLEAAVGVNVAYRTVTVP